MSRFNRLRNYLTGAAVGALATAVLAVPGSGTGITLATETAPSGDGASATATVASLGARWAIFDSAPGNLGTAPMAGGYDAVDSRGRTVKHVAVTMGGNPDVATVDSVNRNVYSTDSGKTIDHSDKAPWHAGNYLRLSDGRLLSLAFIPTNDSGFQTAPDGTKTYHPVKLRQYISSDQGKTWTETNPVVADPPGVQFGMNRGMRINRGISELPDGTLLAGAYTNYGPDTNPTRTILLQSNDHGASWSVRSTVMFTLDYYDAEIGKQVTVGSDELAYSFTTDDRMVAVSRSQIQGGAFADGKMLTAFSDDLGKTWSAPQLLLGPDGNSVQGINPGLVLQPNGILLLSTGRPDNYLYVNNDGTGKTWDVKKLVFSNPPPGKDTYPANEWGSGGNTSMLSVSANRSLFFYDTCITNGWCKPYNEQYSDFAVYVDAVTAGTGKIDVMTQLLDKVATVTGDFAPADPLFPEQRPEGAFDSSTAAKAATVLKAAPGVRPVMRLKLDKPYLIDKIGLMLGNGQPLNATVQVSADGKAWAKPKVQAAATRDHAMRYTTMAPQKVQYVQITGDADVVTPITELELYSADTDTFENDAPYDIPRGWTAGQNASVTDVSMDVGSLDGAGLHSERALRLFDRYTNQVATITKQTPSTAHQITNFSFKEGYPYDAFTFTVKGKSGTALNNLYHFSVNGQDTASPWIQVYNGKAWAVIGRLSSLKTKVWHQVHIDATMTSATVTIDGQSFTTSTHWQSADTMDGMGFAGAGTPARNTEVYLDDVQVTQG